MSGEVFASFLHDARALELWEERRGTLLADGKTIRQWRADGAIVQLELPIVAAPPHPNDTVCMHTLALAFEERVSAGMVLQCGNGPIWTEEGEDNSTDRRGYKLALLIHTPQVPTFLVEHVLKIPAVFPGEQMITVHHLPSDVVQLEGTSFCRRKGDTRDYVALAWMQASGSYYSYDAPVELLKDEEWLRQHRGCFPGSDEEWARASAEAADISMRIAMQNRSVKHD